MHGFHPLRSPAWALSTCRAPTELEVRDANGRSRRIGVTNDGRVAVDLAGTCDGSLARATVAGVVDEAPEILEDCSALWAAVFHSLRSLKAQQAFQSIQ